MCQAAALLGLGRPGSGSPLILSLKLWYWGIQAAWSGSASSDRRCLMVVCICDLACLHPACPGMACCPWQMGATSNHCCSRQEPGDCDPFYLHFSRACGCVGTSPKHHLRIWKQCICGQWRPSGAAAQVLEASLSREKGWLQGTGSADCRASSTFLVCFSEEKP